MSNSLELVSDYIKIRSNNISEYLLEIKENCIQLMAKSTKSSMVKEAGLRPLIKLLETFNATKLAGVIDPNGLVEILLDNKLKFEEKTMGSTLRGAIYNMLGLLVSHFETEVQHRIPEIQHLLYIRIKTELNKGSKTEEKSLAGMLKGLAYGLKSFDYSPEILHELFNYVKALMTPIESRYAIPRAAMKIISLNSAVFSKSITENAITLFNILNDLTRQSPYSLKYLAQDCSEQCLTVLADNLNNEADSHMQAFEYIIKILRNQIEAPQGTQGLPNTLRALGVFSQAIVKFRGEDYLKMLLEKIIDLSEQYIFKIEIEEESFKAVMLKQKSLANFLISYSDISRSLTCIPEHILMHFSRVTLEIFRRNPRIIKKYRYLMYQAIAQLFSSIYLQINQFGPWIKLFVTRSMNELLTIPEDELENTPGRIKLASQLWAGILTQETLTEKLIQQILDEIAQFYFNILQTLDLNYALKGNLGDILMIANSPEEQQFFYQATEFSTKFFKKMADRLTG